MATWDPVDVSHLDRGEIEDLYADWDDSFTSNLEMRFNRLRGFDRTLYESTDEDTIEMTEKAKDRFKRGTIELIVNEIYDKLTDLFNN